MRCVNSEHIALPVFRERLSNFEAANTGGFSGHGYKIEILSSPWHCP